MPKISVIICSHNPDADFLRRTLAALRAQKLEKSEWELLLVDNCSAEPLHATWNLSWHPHARHVREEETGLTPARLRGIRESEGELIIFVDDDNTLSPDYLQNALEIALLFPHLGVFGAGILEPEFQIPPPASVLGLTHLLAIRTVNRTTWSNNCQDTQCIPWGAGLCVRREIANRYLDLIEVLAVRRLLDRRGEQLFSGGDDLFSLVAVSEGRGFGLFTELRIVHLIKRGRLNESYFIRLLHDHAFSSGIMRYLIFGHTPRRNSPGSTLRALLHGMRRGRFSLRCRWAELTGANHAARFIAKENLRSHVGEVFGRGRGGKFPRREGVTSEGVYSHSGGKSSLG